MTDRRLSVACHSKHVILSEAKNLYGKPVILSEAKNLYGKRVILSAAKNLIGQNDKNNT